MDNNKRKVFELVGKVWELNPNYSFNEIVCSLQGDFDSWSYIHDPAFIQDKYFIEFLELYLDKKQDLYRTFKI